MIGARLSHFQISTQLGEGGMGVVYRATDTRLTREVAIKVLPEALAADPERLARFEREAKVLASLNHPRIASIYSFESAVPEPAEPGEPVGRRVHFLVMELADGEDLARRLARGAVPVDEALPIALQIAEALEAAHERGIIHRDLKPANIKVDREGRVKVLDFGLAKALEPETGGDREASPSALAESPTLTAEMTRAGVILGTAAYMSPEQVRGRRLDKRSDIWAFGVVLWEMLSGRRLFAGDSVSETLAEVLTRHPDASQLPENVPERVRWLLDRCLERDPGRRLRDIGEARIALEDDRQGDPRDAVAAEPAGRRTASGLLAWAIAAVAVVLAAIGVWWGATREAAKPPEVVRTSIELPRDAPLVMGPRAAIAISPDGRLVAYVGGTRERHRLYLRDLARGDVRAAEGTEGAAGLRFTPDGGSIAFDVGGKLLEVATTGGPVQQLIGLTPVVRGIDWLPGNEIVFTPHKAAGLFRASLSGPPDVTRLTDPAAGGMIGHCWPDLLPDGERALVTAQPTEATTWDEAHILLVDLESGESEPLIEGGSHARYLPTGHVVFARHGELLAAPFDVERGRLTGPPVVVVDDLLTDPASGAAYFAISDAGTLVYAEGGSRIAAAEQLVWVDRQGRREVITPEARSILYLRLSPDGRRVVVTNDGASDDLWLVDVERGIFQRATFGGRYVLPLWGPGADEITYASPRGSFPAIYVQRLGSPEPTKVVGGDSAFLPGSWSPDGQALVAMHGGATGSWDIALVTREGEVRDLFASPFEEVAPRISPDGRWLAFVSDESGVSEVYVSSFPEPRGRTQVSTAGGTQPVWSPTREALYYREGNRLLEVSVDGDAEPRVTPPRPVLEGEFARGGYIPGTAFYDVSASDERFLMVVEQPPPEIDHLQVVQNWFGELERQVPSGER